MMDTPFDFDSEPIFDGLFSTSASPRNPFNIETPDSCEHKEAEPDPSTPDLPDEEELLDKSSIVQTRHSSNELTELVEAPFLRSNIGAVSIPFTSTLIYPKSQYNGYVPPVPLFQERVAVQELRHSLDGEERLQTSFTKTISEGEDFDEFELADFTIYLPEKSLHSFELRGLQDFASKTGCLTMLLDGVLCAGPHRRYIQGVAFETCSIGNYGKEFHTVGEEIWIQTAFNKKSKLYYRLKTPSQEYRRFHSEFLWLADLAKHFFDYCEACEEEDKAVSVHNFREDFSYWLLKSHEDSAEFKAWYEKFPGSDYRQAVSANIKFLFKETIGVRDELRTQPIWNELLEQNFISKQDIEQYQTVVTPYVYECFEHLRFAQYLKVVEPVSEANSQQSHQGKSLHLTLTHALSYPAVEIPSAHQSHTISSPSRMPAKVSTTTAAKERQQKIKAIRVGDVISVIKDGEGSVWKDEITRWKRKDSCWYVSVQAVHKLHNVGRSFDGIWLYKPSDTSCAKMKYPYANELFCSNHCTCRKGKMQGRIEEEAVLDVVSVVWHGQPSKSSKDMFIRQTYLDNQTFVTFKDSHKTCKHSKSEGAASRTYKYPIGQTVLVPPSKLSPPCRKSRYDLDPYEIVKYNVSHSIQYAILRKLLRRNEIKGQSFCSPNELVYTEETVKVEPENIEYTCIVRFYTMDEMINRTIPAPYNRNGTGNAFYITSKLAGDGRELTPIGADPSISLIQGLDPYGENGRKKLHGLDLYCGGGNFGRGLEEGQAVHNKWAVDMDKTAIHTYHANLLVPQDTQLYFGSVNDHLYQALQANPKNLKLIPRPGDVDFISAGSPCQGFSLLNNSREQEKGLKNQSMVASVAAYIDFYRPKYGLIENVLNMAQKGKERDHDVLSQLICAIVGMGYQVSTFLIDAWSYGSPQSRSRIFVAFTAPGLEPIPHPQQSHSHPPKTNERGLGLQANGQAFGERRHDPTPLKFVTAGEAVTDLTSIGDGSTYTCIPYPDHVVQKGVSTDLRVRIAAIPTFPRGMNFWKSWNDGKGVMSKEQRALFPSSINRVGNASQCVGKTSRAWGRVNPNHLFQTIVVNSHPADARMGTVLHWDQNRCLTVMEGRRTQSFPDHEVIVGTESQRMKIIGNSVDRSVALALGLALREAWEKTPLHDKKFTTVVDHAPVTRQRLLSPLPTQPLNPRQAKFQSGEIPASDRKLDSQPMPSKRTYSLVVNEITPSAKSLKAAKLSKTLSPASSSKQAEARIIAKATKNTNPVSHPRDGPVNASRLSEKLQVVLEQHMAKSNQAVANVEESDGSKFSTQSGQPRVKRTLNLRTFKSPTKARPKTQCFIDLTSDGEDEGLVAPRIPPAKLPVRPAVMIPPSRYVLAENNPFSPYAQTYRAQNMEQSRKHGPKN